MSEVESKRDLKTRLLDNWVWYAAGGGGALVVVIGIIYLVLPSAKQTTRKSGNVEATDPQEQARQAFLSKAPDVTTLRGGLQQLNVHLGKNPERKPVPLTAEQRQWLEENKELSLDHDEWAEVENNTFTPLDGQYLDLCFLLRDAALSLELGQPPAESRAVFGALLLTEEKQLARAAAAFAWVTRQVQLQENAGAYPVPPHFALRHGWGTTIERCLVFLTLLRQLGLEGCLLGNETQRDQFQIWACGARIGNDIYLFEPRLGLPLPGANGRGTATLAALRAQPELLKQFTTQEAYRFSSPMIEVGGTATAAAVNPPRKHEVTPKQIQESRIYVVCPLSALAPRMKYLQDELRTANVDVTLAVDLEGMLGRFEAAARHPEGKAAPPVQVLTPAVRFLRNFLPPEEGGADQTQYMIQWYLGLMPRNALPQLLQATDGEPRKRLLGQLVDPFLDLKLSPHKARDCVLRGRFAEATKDLDEKYRRVKQMRRQKERREELDEQAKQERKPTVAQQVEAWLKEQINRAYVDRFRAQRAAEAAGDKDRAAQAAVTAAKGRVETLWKEGQPLLSLLLEGSQADSFGAELTFLVALRNHEQAEQLQTRADRKPTPAAVKAAQDAWKDAESSWAEYTSEYGFSPRVIAAYSLHARTLEQLGRRDEAVTVLKNLCDVLRSQERNDPATLAPQMLQALYRMKRLQTADRGSE